VTYLKLIISSAKQVAAPLISTASSCLRGREECVVH